MALEKPKSVLESPYRAAKWDEITEGREFTQADAPYIALLCQWYEINDMALDEISRDGEIMTAYTNEAGDIKALPQLSTMAKASAEIRALSKQLGLYDQQREEKPKPVVRVTPFERIAKQRANGPMRKPNAQIPNSA